MFYAKYQVNIFANKIIILYLRLLINALNKYEVAGLFAITAWSFSGLMAVISNSVPLFQLLAYSNLLTAFYYFILFNLNIFPNERKPPKLQLTRDFWIVFFGVSSYFCCYYSAFKFAPALQVNSLNYLWPILTAVIASIFFDKKAMPLSLIVWLSLAFISVIGILNSSNTVQIEFKPQQIWGFFLAILAATVWAVYNNLTRHLDANKISMALVFLSIGCVSLLTSIIFETHHSLEPKQMAGIFGLSIVNLGYAAWDYSLKGVKLKFILGLSYLIPIFSTALLWTFTNHSVSVLFILYSSIIFMSSYFIGSSSSSRN